MNTGQIYKPHMSFDEIGLKLGLSHERVRQIYKDAMEKIQRELGRDPEKAMALANFLRGAPNPTGYIKYGETNESNN